MKLIEVKDYEAMSKQGVDIMIKLIKDKPDAYLCLATGSSPQRMYELLVQEINEQKIDISQLTFVKLDEWYGVEPNHACTCTTFIKTNVLNKLYMQPKQFLEFQSNTTDIQKEVGRMENLLQEHPLDMMILGLGMDGHLGLNEPADYLTLPCHESILHPKTKTHEMVKHVQVERGMTIGFHGIFTSKNVLMLLTGDHKENAYQAFMSQQISTQVPASLLWLHTNCITIIDHSHFR